MSKLPIYTEVRTTRELTQEWIDDETGAVTMTSVAPAGSPAVIVDIYEDGSYMLEVFEMTGRNDGTDTIDVFDATDDDIEYVGDAYRQKLAEFAAQHRKETP